MKENQEVIGLVGIFWLMPDMKDFFHVAAVAVAEGQTYGDWILGGDDHATLWDRLHSSGELDMLPCRYREDYARLPRGRVSFNWRKNFFTVYAGKWMSDSLKSMILDRFQLKEGNTEFEDDGHYWI